MTTLRHLSIRPALLALVCTMTLQPVFAADDPTAGTSALKGAIDTLPEATGGECYAKVSVPAVYSTTRINPVIKEATQLITVTEPEFGVDYERILLQDSYTRLVAIPPVYETVTETIEVVPSRLVWVRENVENTVPVAPGVMDDIKRSGVDVGAVAAGQCLYEHFDAGEPNISEQEVITHVATEQFDIIPAKLEPSSTQVRVKPAYETFIATPAVFETIEEPVLIEAAHSVWRKGRGLIERIDNTTGEIMCRVDVPAEYETIQKQVARQPAGVKRMMMPAAYETITTEKLIEDAQESRVAVAAKTQTITRTESFGEAQFSWLDAAGDNATGVSVCKREFESEYIDVERVQIKTPGYYQSIEIPAVYENKEIATLEKAATSVIVPVPAVTTELTQRELISDARLEWRPVVCETNMTKDVVVRLQEALNEAGYSAGTPDGLLGPGTLRALTQFQNANGLPEGGVTYTTIEALGIDL